MAENSNKKPRFLPDPSKWIQTAPSSASSTKKTQRPLTALRNGFATPPTTVKRVPPFQVKRQGSIAGGFFTPTSIKKVEDDSAKRRGSPSISTSTPRPLGRGETIRKSRLAVRADERRSSPDEPEGEVDERDSLLRNRARPTPTTTINSKPKVVPLQTHRSAPVSSSSGMSDAIDQDQSHTPPRQRYRTSSPLFPPGSPVASHISSDRPITPVPDYVLDIHRRLCGREFVRLKSPASAGTGQGQGQGQGQGSPARKRSKSKKEKEKENAKRVIDERAHDRALERRRNKEKEKENENRLVVGSSQSREDEISPKDGKRKRDYIPSLDPPRLAPIVVNSLRHTVSMEHDIPARSTRDVENPVPANAFSPSAVYNELCRSPTPSPNRGRLSAPAPVLINTPPKSRQLRRIPTGTSPRSAIPITSPSPSPAPKSITPMAPPIIRDFKAVPMQAETLLSWGGETTPIRPRPDPRPIQHRQPVAEDADLNETQSLAPSAASQSFPNFIPSPTRPFPATFAHLDEKRPQAGPSKKSSVIMPETIRRNTPMNKSSNTGIFTSRSISRFATDLGVAETILPVNTSNDGQAKPTPKSNTAKQSRPSGSAWPAFGFDDTTPTQAARSRRNDLGKEKSPSSSSKKRKTPTVPSGTQSKLAAFGFFGDKPRKAVRGFEDEWDMEDDLPFDHDSEGDAVPEEKDEKEEGLHSVPAPPPHPDLQPAGLRELKRREATRSTRPPFALNDNNGNEHELDNEMENENLFPDVQPSSSSPRHGGSSTSASASASASSVTTEDELNMNSSAAAWWDGLEDRRSSEFGSVPRLV